MSELCPARSAACPGVGTLHRKRVLYTEKGITQTHTHNYSIHVMHTNCHIHRHTHTFTAGWSHMQRHNDRAFMQTFCQLLCGVCLSTRSIYDTIERSSWHFRLAFKYMHQYRLTDPPFPATGSTPVSSSFSIATLTAAQPTEQKHICIANLKVTHTHTTVLSKLHIQSTFQCAKYPGKLAPDQYYLFRAKVLAEGPGPGPKSNLR